jgi:hypothetical protein
VGVAVKVTLVPAQIVLPGLADIVTEGVTTGFTVIVIAFEVTVAGLAQVALLVRIHVTTWVLVKVLVVKVGLFVPAFTPFTRH